MTKKSYIIDNTEMTIKANWVKLSPTEKAEVKEFIGLGYKFQNKATRDGSKRKRTYFENNLNNSDKEIFDLLRAQIGDDGKAKRGAYSEAASFASTIIKLGKHVDMHPEKAAILDEYRNLVLTDRVEAKLFAKKCLAA